MWSRVFAAVPFTMNTWPKTYLKTTFLVLVHNAAAIRKRSSLAG
jgi:hypothetical protein